MSPAFGDEWARVVRTRYERVPELLMVAELLMVLVVLMVAEVSEVAVRSISTPEINTRERGSKCARRPL